MTREEEVLIQEHGDGAYMSVLELSSDATVINVKDCCLHSKYVDLRNRPTKAILPI